MPHYKAGDEPVPSYRLESFLGQGGFGEVWKAIGPGHIHVAVKIIGLDRVQGLKEFRALWLMKGIHHPNLVPIMGSWLIGEHGEVLSDTQLGDLSTSETPATTGDVLSRIDDSARPAKQEIKVLLIDDQPMVGEAVRRMLAEEADIVYHYCGDPANAVQVAHEISPTVILQDLVMPEVDGLTLVKFFRDKPATHDIPVIVLSTNDNAKTKAEAFALGASDYLVKLPDKIEMIARIRRHANSYIAQRQQKKLAETQVSANTEPATPRMLIIAMGLGECSLGDRLAESAAGIPPGELLEYMREAAKAIDFMNEKSHDLGGDAPASIQHCDIKPQNILIVGGSAQVCDFGLARVLGDVRKTSMGVSPAYGAPECLDGNKPSATTDQYSLAISYVELRTGKLPFEDINSYMAIVNAHLDGKLELSRLPPEERCVIEKATSRDPAERYPSTAAMVYALREAMLRSDDVPDSVKGSDWETPSREMLLSRLPSGSGEHRVADSQKRFRRLSRRLWMSFVGLVLVIALFVVIFLRAWHLETKTESLIRNRQYQEAFESIESYSPWVGWAVAKDRLRGEINVHWCKDVDEAIHQKQWNRAADLLENKPWIDAIAKKERESRLGVLKENWRVEFHMQAAAGNIEQSEATRNALRLRFADYEPAHHPAPDRISLTPEQLLDVVQEQLDDAWATFDSSPAESVRKCDYAWKNLARPSIASAEERVKQRAVQLRREVLLLRARANSRQTPPDWDAVRADLQRLGETPPEGTEETADQAALQTALELLSEEVNPSLDTNGTTALLDRCKENLAGAGAEEDDRWAPGESELANALLVKADMEARLNRLGDRLETLRLAMKYATQEQQAKINTQIAILRGLDELDKVDPSDTSQMEDAIERLDKLRDKMMPELLLVFADRLVKIAGSAAPQLQGDCVDRLDGILRVLSRSSQFADSKEKKLLDDWLAGWRKQHAELFAQHRAALIAALESPEKPDFANLLQKCNAARRYGALESAGKLCRAECLVELASGEQADANRQEAARIAPDPDRMAEADAARPYAYYVQALLKPDQAAALMQLAYASDEPSPILSNEYRNHRAGKVLVDAASALRVATKDKSFEQLLASPSIRAADAEKVFAWLTTADRLVGDSGLSPPMKLHLAMAALGKPAPEMAIAEKCLTEMTTKIKAGKCTRDDVPALCLLARVEPSSTADTLAALDAYAELLRLAQQEATSPQVIHKEILEPALALADSLGTSPRLGAEEKMRIASLYGAKGKFVRENEGVSDKLNEVALDAYNRAIAYDKSAEYYAGRGKCWIDGKRLPEAEKDAREAIALDSEFPGGHGLLGHIYLMQSRQAGADRLARLGEAVTSCTKAIDLTKQDDRETAYTLIDRSAANVEIVAYSSDMPMEKKEELLKQACADARRARGIDTAYNDFACISLGNALEDLARVDKDLNNYDKAREAFSEALKVNPKPGYSLARGRCAFKAVCDGKADQRLLASAIEDLEAVTNRDPGLPGAREWLPEAHFWLGRVYDYQKKPELAAKSFQKVTELDPTNHSRSYWLASALFDAGKLQEADKVFLKTVTLAREANSPLLFDYFGLWAQKIKPYHAAAGERVALLGPLADDLVKTNVKAPQAKLFVGLVHEIEKRWADAAKTYDEGLAATESAKPTHRALRYKLAYHRSKANLERLALIKDAAKQKEAATKIGDRLYADADTAVEAALTDDQRAVALAQAARARGWWLDNGMEPDQEKATAIWDKTKGQFREAIKLAPKHPDGSLWRYIFVHRWRVRDASLYRKDSPENKEALRYLNEILQSPGVPALEREMTKRMKSELEGSR